MAYPALVRSLTTKSISGFCSRVTKKISAVPISTSGATELSQKPTSKRNSTMLSMAAFEAHKPSRTLFHTAN
jgi:hypothetical protein